LGGGGGAHKLPPKDDAFDRLFDTVDVRKMAAPAACVSNSDRSASDLTSSNQSAGLFQSFHERLEPAAAGRPKKKSYRRPKSRVLAHAAKKPASDISDLCTTLDVQIKCETRVSTVGEGKLKSVVIVHLFCSLKKKPRPESEY
jgi:hypothetical protein